jgi:hypothetical protein
VLPLLHFFILIIIPFHLLSTEKKVHLRRLDLWLGFLCEKEKKRYLSLSHQITLHFYYFYHTYTKYILKNGNFFECVYRATEFLSSIQEKRVYYEGASFAFLQTRDEEMTTRERHKSDDDVQK